MSSIRSYCGIMKMIRFNCDYSEGAHPRILERLMETNLMQTEVYGEDQFCQRAKELISSHLGRVDADIHFLVGGTQTNLTLISSVLRPYEGVLSAVTGHIGVHETGSIEATGHKVLTIPTADGKLSSRQIREMYMGHVNDVNHEHMVRPGMVYISQPTENGTLYSLKELEEISAVCKHSGLFFYVDGARLGYGLASPKADFTIADLARLTDAFYIGGTKQGALFGEALVIMNSSIRKNFRYSIKQKGALLAKGRLLGIQYEALFDDTSADRKPLYFQMAENAIDKAMRIKTALQNKGIDLLFDSWTNQQYPVFEKSQLEKLEKDFVFDFWAEFSGTKNAVRICTSWATREDDTQTLINAINNL